MGIFSKKHICSICNEEHTNKKLINGYICNTCIKDAGCLITNTKNHTIENINEKINLKNLNKERLKIFNTTKKIGKFIEFDDLNKMLIITEGLDPKRFNLKVYDYKDIVEFELLEDGETITKGGIGRAVAGGILFGGVGAVVGAVTGSKKTKEIVTSLKIKITVNDIENPYVYINLIYTKVKVNSLSYKTAYNNAQEILSVLSIITNN